MEREGTFREFAPRRRGALRAAGLAGRAPSGGPPGGLPAARHDAPSRPRYERVTIVRVRMSTRSKVILYLDLVYKQRPTLGGVGLCARSLMVTVNVGSPALSGPVMAKAPPATLSCRSFSAGALIPRPSGSYPGGNLRLADAAGEYQAAPWIMARRLGLLRS